MFNKKITLIIGLILLSACQRPLARNNEIVYNQPFNGDQFFYASEELGEGWHILNVRKKPGNKNSADSASRDFSLSKLQELCPKGDEIEHQESIGSGYRIFYKCK